MSLADNKRNVFTTIGSYTSLMEQGKNPLQTDLYPSINNKKDIVPFLLDVMKTVAGTDALKETIGSMFTGLINDVEPQLKDVLKKQFTQSNSDDPLPASGSNFKNNGITVPLKDIDTSGKLKVNPNSQGGKMLYDNVNPNFDKVTYDAILNEGLPQDFSVFTMTYNGTTDKLQIKPTAVGKNLTTSEFFTQYIDDAEIIDAKEITSKVMDAFYGTLAKNQNKTEEQNYEELQVDLLLQQVLNGDDSFEIAPEDYDALQNKARELTAGVVTYDLGCGLIAPELGIDDFDATIQNISGSSDPSFVADQFEATIDDSTNNDTALEEATQENKQTMKDNFFQKIINILTVQLLIAVTASPQIRVMMGMMSSLQNNGDVKLNKASEDMKNFKTMIKCMSKELMRLVAEFLFALAVGYLIKLLKPVILEVLKEKINQYSGIITSLTGVLGKVTEVIT